MDELEPVRRDAIRLLCAAEAKDLLPLDAFEARLERIKQAPNRATVEAIVADLAPPSGSYTFPTSAPAPASADHTGVTAGPWGPAVPFMPAERLRIASVFASTKRAGSWTVPLELDLVVAFGEITIDLRDAVFGADFLDVDLNVRFGQLTLIVPVGTQVENEVREVFSSSSHSTRDARGAAPIGLLIRLRGRVLFGQLEVKEKPPTGAAKEGQGLWKKLLEAGD